MWKLSKSLLDCCISCETRDDRRCQHWTWGQWAKMNVHFHFTGTISKTSHSSVSTLSVYSFYCIVLLNTSWAVGCYNWYSICCLVMNPDRPRSVQTWRLFDCSLFPYGSVKYMMASSQIHLIWQNPLEDSSGLVVYHANTLVNKTRVPPSLLAIGHIANKHHVCTSYDEGYAHQWDMQGVILSSTCVIRHNHCGNGQHSCLRKKKILVRSIPAYSTCRTHWRLVFDAFLNIHS